MIFFPVFLLFSFHCFFLNTFFYVCKFLFCQFLLQANSVVTISKSRYRGGFIGVTRKHERRQSEMRARAGGAMLTGLEKGWRQFSWFRTRAAPIFFVKYKQRNLLNGQERDLAHVACVCFVMHVCRFVFWDFGNSLRNTYAIRRVPNATPTQHPRNTHAIPTQFS